MKTHIYRQHILLTRMIAKKADKCLADAFHCGIQILSASLHGTPRLLAAFLLSCVIASPASAGEFTVTGIGDYGNVTVMEAAGDYDAEDAAGKLNSAPRQAIAKEFFKDHKDEYDFMVIFSNFNFAMHDAATKAFYTGVKNDTQGIGIERFDNTAFYGSAGRLQGTIDMGNLSKLSVDPMDPQFEETLSTLSHEIMHRWGAQVKLKDASGKLSDALLGKDGSHWSFLLDSGGSIMYGNTWQDNKNGTFTSTTPMSVMKFYSPLDLYLMGMIDKSKVPPILLIENPDIDFTQMPQTGVTISGIARTVTIDDIIAANGQRIPDVSSSRKKFKTAFILITEPGTFTGAEVYGIENIRNGFVTRHSILTDGMSIMEVASTVKDEVPTNPGVLPPSTDSRTLPPSINDGVSWLMTNQQPDGSWKDLMQTVERDTAEAVLTLRNFPLAQQNYHDGIVWLGNTSSGNLDFLSRKIEALAGSGQDVTAILNNVLSRRNADGGWGSDQNYESDAGDTALSLKALASAGYTGQSAIAQAVGYLASIQNADGSWGSEDKGGMVQETANVLSAFNKYRATYQLDDAIARGTTWLIGRQNSDGGFGNSPSTVYDTAVATMTLRELNASSSVTNNALTYLLGQQTENGSWNNSAYQTALAVETVYTSTVDPDLSITSSDITIIPGTIKSLPSSIVINANISNLGQTSAQAKVVFYEGSIADQNKLGEQTLSFPGQASTSVTFSAVAQDGSEHRFYVLVDPDNVVKESNELNNTAVKILRPEATYDFEILPQDIHVSANPVDVFQDVTITSKITNKGTMNAYNAQVRYFIDEPGNPHLIATTTIDLPAGATVSNSATWRVNKAGTNMSLAVEADPLKTFDEVSETNNKTALPITVNGADAPNLTISNNSITITPSPANESGNATISAIVRNEGFSTANNIVVKFYNGVPELSGALLGPDIIPSIAPGQTAVSSFEWMDIQETGEKIIYVQVDPDNLVLEGRNDDNEAYTTLTILTLTDLAISTNSITFVPVTPKEGDNLTINALVQNNGEQSAQQVTVTAYEGGTTIGSQTVPVIAGNSQVTVSIAYSGTMTQGLHQITIKVDSDNSIMEKREDNNSATRAVSVQNADLWISEPYISPNGDGIKDSTAFTFRLAAAQTTSVVVSNHKEETIRTFSGGDLENSSSATIIWNGLDDNGMVVPDGQYQMKVLGANSALLGSVSVVVDNNRSSFTEAIGTKYFMQSSLGTLMPRDSWQWLPDDSGFIFHLAESNANYPDYSTGLYTMAPNGEGITRLTPEDWTKGKDLVYDYVYRTNSSRCNTDTSWSSSPNPEKNNGYVFSPDGGQVAFMLEKFNKMTQKTELSQLWIGDRYGESLFQLDSYDHLKGQVIFITDIFWSPDSAYVAFKTLDQTTGQFKLVIAKSDGMGKVEITTEWTGDIGLNHQVYWSPDSKRFAYISNYQVIITDLLGNKQDVLTVKSSNVAVDWFDLDRILVRDFQGNISVIDITGSQSPILIEENAGYWSMFYDEESCIKSGGSGYYYMPISSTGYFVYYDEDEQPRFGEDTWSTFKICNVEGQCEIAFDLSATSIIGWSPDGTKLVKYGWQTDTMMAYDVITKTTDIYPVGDYYCYWSVLPPDLPASFHVWPYISEDMCTNGSTYFDIISWQWMDDSSSFLAYYYENRWVNGARIDQDHIIVFNAANGHKEILPIDANDVQSLRLSPQRNHLLYRQYDINDSTKNQWQLVGSTLNLTSYLNIIKTKSAITLKGIAADANFEGYKLEYADTDSPQTWNLIMPPSDVPQMDGTFTTWIPPNEGTFFVKLTVWDKAGNTTFSKRRVSWGLPAPRINSVSLSQSIFSPNGDGNKDSVELNYRIVAAEPVRFDFYIYDENDELITTVTKWYMANAEDYIRWDGHDSSGNIVPDGKYKIKVVDYEFFVEVDNKEPQVEATFGSIYKDEKNRLWINLSGHIVDSNIKTWSIELGEGDNPQQWTDFMSGDGQVVGKDKDGNPILNPAEDVIVTSFNSSGFSYLEGKKLRVTAEDYAGNKRSVITDYAKSVYLAISTDVDRVACTMNAGEGISYSINDKFQTLKLQIQSTTDTRYSQWTDFQVYTRPNVPEGAFELGLPDVRAGAHYTLRIIAVGESGNSYTSATTELTAKITCEGRTLSVSLDIAYPEADCGLASNMAKISSALKNISEGVKLKTLNYVIDKSGGAEILREYDLSRELWGGVSIDTSAMAEGSYPVRANVAYDNATAVASGTLIVDRVLPTARVTYPKQSEMACRLKTSDSKGDWDRIPIQGISTDGNSVKYYELYYGAGESPSTWLPAMTRVNGKSKTITGSGNAQGLLGDWDVTDLSGTSYSLKLKVVDVVGNVSCYAISFSIKQRIEMPTLTVDRKLISPNNDGAADNATINYRIDEYAVVDVKVFKLLQGSSGSVLDSTPVRTIESGLQHINGAASAIWDGSGDAGENVPDGQYGIAVLATDLCGNANIMWTGVEVDNTLPAALIDYPKPLDPLGNVVVEVKGTADDLHFKNYTLEAGQGNYPGTWAAVSGKNTPVKNNILGNWNTFGLDGIWTLRLTATDTVGNKNSTTVAIDLGLRKTLIKDLDAAPRLFSPNSDGKLDAAVITYALTDACQITIDILDTSGNIQKTYTTSTPSLGSYIYTWDGRDNTGSLVLDGAYTVALDATLVSNPSVTQDETITLIVDSTLPTIDIKQPANNAYIAASGVPVNGTISDLNLTTYSITSTDDSGTTEVDQASQSRENHTFGVLNDLAEGRYTLNVQAKDLGENENNTDIVFTIDRTPPVVKLEMPKDGEYYGGTSSAVSSQPSATADIVGSIVEKNLDVFNLRYGPGDNPAQWTDLVTGTTVTALPQSFAWSIGQSAGIPDGAYTLSLFTKDKAGLIGEAKVKVTIDNTPPTVSITSPQEGGYVKSALEIKGTAFDQNLEKYIVEISEGSCANAFKWAGIKSATASVQDNALAKWQALPSDGDYCLRATATDKVGSSSEVKVNVKVDTHPPAASVLSGKVDNKTNAQLDWTRNTEPDISGYTVYRGGQKVNAEIIACCGLRDENLGEGNYVYTVSVVDNAGWESPVSNEVKLAIDAAGPAAGISSPAKSAMVSDLIDIKGTAFSKSDFKEYRLSIGPGAEPGAWDLLRASPVPISYGTLAQWDTFGLGEGPYSIKLEAEDLSGNVSTHQILVTVDNTPPSAPVLLSAAPNGSDAAIVWQLNTEADVSGYLLYRNDQLANATGSVIGDLNPYLLSGPTYTNTSLPDGAFTYAVSVMDEAGNFSELSNTITFTIDTHAPKATIIEPANNAKINQPTLVLAESDDLDIASIQFQFKRTQDSTWTDLGSATTTRPFAVTLDPAALGLSQGDYHLRAVATDTGAEGQPKIDPSPAQIMVTFVDLTAPAAPSGLAALTNASEVTLSWAANSETDLAGYNVYRNAQKINATVITSSELRDQNLADGTYSYAVTAIDTNNNESKVSGNAGARIYAPAIVPPDAVTGTGTIRITGSNADANALVDLYVDNEAGNGLTTTTTVLADNAGTIAADIELSLGNNIITARARDGIGNLSRMSNAVSVIYNEPPAAPTGLTADVQGETVNLTWDPNSETDLMGYYLYRDNVKVNSPMTISPGEIYTSSTQSYPSYNIYLTGDKAFDGNPNSSWMSAAPNGPFTPQWMGMGFIDTQWMRTVEIYWTTDYYAARDYEIQSWNGNAWETIAAVTGNTATVNVVEIRPLFFTTKLRIYITAPSVRAQTGNKMVGISEIIIYKDQAATLTSFADAPPTRGAHNYSLTAVDVYGLESQPSVTVSVTVGDVTPPLAPVALSATAVDSTVVLGWSAGTEPDLAGYTVYRLNGPVWDKLQFGLVTEMSFTDSNLVNGTYYYRITATDTSGNESGPSNVVSSTVAIAALMAPSGLGAVALAEGAALKLSWNPASGAPAGYHLYRSAVDGGPYARLNSSLLTDVVYLDSGLSNNTMYYYVVTAVDILGNESAYSPEAMGVPQDIIVPKKPVIHSPTVSDIPLTVTSDNTTISGTAEASSVVKLFRDGEPQGQVMATTDPREETYPLPLNSYGFTLSPDELSLAYYTWEASAYSVWIKSLQTGATTTIASNGHSPKWSPVGDKLTYKVRDVDWNNHIWIYDVQTGTSMPLNDDASNESSSAWSPDGMKIAYSSNRSGLYAVWMKDLQSGLISQLTSSDGAYGPLFSPDGAKLAYFENASLYVRDLTSGEAKLVEDNSDTWSLSWSHDSSSLAFVSYQNGYGDIYTYNLITQKRVQVTNLMSDEPYYPIWSADGENILFDQWDPVTHEDALGMAPAHRSGETTYLEEHVSIYSLERTTSGQIVYADGNAGTLNKISLGDGQFEFKDVLLNAGENLFTVTATDASGNDSVPSEPITVIYDTSTLTDLTTSSDDVYLYPPFPIAGQQMAVNAIILNRGQTDAKNVDVLVYLWNVHGVLELLKSVQVPIIAANSSELVSAVWDSTGMTGQNRIVVVADPYDAIAESDETNNMAIKDFIVSDHAGITMTTAMDCTQCRSNQNVISTVTLWNNGDKTSGTLNVRIEDESGRFVSAFAPTDTSLSYGQERQYQFTWNTGSTYAGSYRVRSVLTASTGVVSENTTTFSILPDAGLDLSVATDKAVYGPSENVATKFTIKNTGTNTIIPTLQATVSISSAAGTVLSSETKTASNLMPGSSVDLNSSWNTGLNIPGDYHATVAVSFDGGTPVTKSAGFRTNTSLVLTGTIKVSPVVVPAGSVTLVSYTLTNAGNADAYGLTTRTTILDAETQIIMQISEETMDLPATTGRSGQIAVNTMGYSLKTYTAVLQTVSQGVTKNIATTNFTVKDLTPPALTISSPVSNSAYEASVPISVFASDDASGVDRVEYQVDGNGWKLLPVADPSHGRYAATWDTVSADNGGHTIFFKAVDKAGNATTPVLIEITIQNQADTTPPILSLSTLADGAITNNDTLNIAGTASHANGIQSVVVSGQTVTTFTSDNVNYTFSQAVGLATGPNLITTVATANNGNTASDTRTITLDQSAPVITIIHPPDNSNTNEVETTMTGTVDKTSTVSIKVNNTSPGPALVTELTFSLPIAYDYGQNTIEVTATDLAGNIGTAKRTVTFDNLNPALAITNPAQDITTNEAGILIQGTVADLTITEVMITCDGITSSPTVTGVTFEQQITVTDEKTYTVIVIATDGAGNTSTVQRNIIYDKTPPALSIDPVETPTKISQQVVTGTMELHSTVTVDCLTAEVGMVSYHTSTTWSVIIAGMAEGANLITVTATDQVGNVSDSVSATIVLNTLGLCAGTAGNCDDGNPCTADSCNPETGCIHTTINCNDGNACTTDSCSPATGCVRTTISCDDSNACTADSCNPAMGCVNTSIICNDNSACTADTCNSETGCVYTPIVCNDNSACTTDTCNSATGCVYTPISCNDSNACTTDSCDAATGCINTAISCDDSNACSTDTCDAATGCIHTTIICDDSNACTVDSCDSAAGCRNTAISCNDNNTCTIDTCKPASGCVYTATVPVSCNDGNACTTNGCAANSCTHTTISCDDSNACTADSCDPVSGCVHNTINCNDNNVCTTDSCNSASGCVHTSNAAACSDNNACTSNDICFGGTCSGTAIDCNDNNACTADACDPATGCVYTPVTCNDNDICTADSCKSATGCVYTTTVPATCNDNNACTTDGCTANACTQATIDCDDSNACTADSCDPATGCVYATITCNDNNACTTDACNSATGACVYTPVANGTTCDDRNPATVNDSCTNGTCTGTLDQYNFTGFFTPVDNHPYLNTANAGQAIPVKWRLTDANGAPVPDSASFKSMTSYLINCASFTGDPADAIEEYAAGSSGLLYLGDGNWHFNWKTPKTYAKQCRIMVLTLGDNSTHTAQFKFK